MLSVTIECFCMGDAEVFMALGASFSPDPLLAMLETTQRPDAETDIQDTIRWYCTHEMVDARGRAETNVGQLLKTRLHIG